MGFVVWLLVGLVAGAVASLIVPSRTPVGTVGALVVGLLGGLLGGWLADLVGLGHGTSWLGSLVVAVLGAALLLSALRAREERRRA